MALKDWKKVDANLWRKENHLVFISIWDYPNNKPKYIPHEANINEKRGRAIKRGAFDKPIAIKIAKEYMKKH